MPTRIYLADLTHDGAGKYATDLMPYNIGLIAAYARSVLGDGVDIRLFKYAERLFAAIDEHPPDILGCSNYCWNANLSSWACEYTKQRNPAVVTVMGGTNYPFKTAPQKRFFGHMPFTDFHVYYEGEASFVNLLEAYQAQPDLRLLKETPIGGVQSLSPTTGEVVSGAAVPRIKSLDDIPSPYTSGILDEFFDGHLSPILESTRGCPFSCNFCNAADAYYTKVNMFSLERIREEIAYLGPRMQHLGIHNMVLADNNFGMFARDAEFSRILVESRDRYGWPLHIYATTGKNNKTRILEATKILGGMAELNMSVQSMDKGVLKNIRRDNIKVEVFKDINKRLQSEGRNGHGEVIVPLPGETFETYMAGLRALIESGVQVITSYTLLAIHGTPYKDDPAFIDIWKYKTKWRIIPNQFGLYASRAIFDSEEVGIESSSMSFADYLRIRDFVLITELAYNANIFGELIKLLKERGISAFDWLRAIDRRLALASAEIGAVVDSFRRSTRSELWESETALREHYESPEHYRRLRDGEAGFNVVYTHKAWMLSDHADVWICFIVACARDLMTGDATAADPELDRQLDDMATHMRYRVTGVLGSDGPGEDLYAETRYNFRDWLRDPDGSLADYRSESGFKVRYYFNQLQLDDRIESSSRYGDTFIGKAKIMAHRLWANVLRQIDVEGFRDDQWTRVPAAESGTVAVRNP